MPVNLPDGAPAARSGIGGVRGASGACEGGGAAPRAPNLPVNWPGIDSVPGGAIGTVGGTGSDADSWRFPVAMNIWVNSPRGLSIAEGLGASEDRGSGGEVSASFIAETGGLVPGAPV